MMALFFAVLILVLPAVHVQEAPAPRGDETKIIALENLWNQMQINHDGEAIAKLLDNDFVLTDYDGTVMNKAQFVNSIRDKAYVVTVEVSEGMQLHAHGGTVIV